MNLLSSSLNLPDPAHKRWVSHDKERVVHAVTSGWLSLRQACQHYRLSVDEFLDWRRRYAQHKQRQVRQS
jgi:hypothetical protein